MKFHIRALDSTPSSLFQWFASMRFHSIPFLAGAWRLWDRSQQFHAIGSARLEFFQGRPGCGVRQLTAGNTHTSQSRMHSSTTGWHTRTAEDRPPSQEAASTHKSKHGGRQQEDWCRSPMISQSIHVWDTYYKKNTRKKQL